MILNTLRLENYKQYGRLELEFREGLVGIVGRNGAGKSTLFEAILYCLFGNDDSEKTLIRSAFADPKAPVTLQLAFTLGLERYEVRREFRGKTMTVGAELYKNDAQIAKGVSAVNHEVERLLGMERETFKRSVFSGQTELAELSNLKKGDRKVKVRRMLGLDTLDEIQTRINRDLNAVNNQIAGQRQNLLEETAVHQLEAEIEEISKSLDSNALQLESAQKDLQAAEEKHRGEKQKFDEAEQKRIRHNALEHGLAQLRERLTNLLGRRDNLAQKQRDLAALREKTEARRAEFSTFEAEKKTLRELEKLGQHKLNQDVYRGQIQDLQEPLAEAAARVEKLQEELLEQEKVAAELTAHQALAHSAEQEIEAKRAEYQELDGAAKVLKSQIEERRHKIAELREIGKSGTCPTCFQPLLDAYDKVLAQLTTDIESIQNQQLASIETQKTDLAEAGKSLKNRQTEISRAVDSLKRRQDRLIELAKQKTKEEADLQRLKAQVVKIELILREIGEVDFDEAKYSALKTRLDAAEPHYRQWQNDLNYLERESPVILKDLQNTTEGIAVTEQNLTQTTEELGRTGFDMARYEAVKQTVTNFAEVLRAQSDVVNQLEKTGLALERDIRSCREKLLANEQVMARIRDKLAEAEDLEKLQKMLGTFKNEILEKISPVISREASGLFSRITLGKYESIRVDENFDFSIADGGVFYPIERFSGGEIDLANFCLRIAVTKAIAELNGSGQGVEFLAFDEIFGSQDEERRHEIMLALNYLREQFRQIYIVSHIESLRDYFDAILEVKTAQEGGSTARWV